MHIVGVWARDVRMENRQGLMHEVPPIAERNIAMGVSLWMLAFIYFAGELPKAVILTPAKLIRSNPIGFVFYGIARNFHKANAIFLRLINCIFIKRHSAKTQIDFIILIIRK
jgi:hypothetical protein